MCSVFRGVGLTCVWLAEFILRVQCAESPQGHQFQSPQRAVSSPSHSGDGEGNLLL